MLRVFRISINGKVFDVTVEELTGGSVSGPVSVSAAVAPPAPTPVQPSPVMKQVPAAAAVQVPDIAPSARTSVPTGTGVVKAPIPGTVTSIKVAPSQAVKRGDVLLILEAMKMENEICAHTDGMIARILIEAGSMVNVGDSLVDIES